MRFFSSGRYAVVTSTLALVVALSSASYAAVVVTGKQIKNNTVTTQDIKDKTIKTKDISGAAKNALKGSAGPVGPVGPAGPTTRTTVVRVEQVVEYAQAVVTAMCPAGSVATGGGYGTDYINASIMSSEPVTLAAAPTTPIGWSSKWQLWAPTLGDPLPVVQTWAVCTIP